MGRPRHPSKEIEKAIQHAESLGWRVGLSNGHRWGYLLCPRATREGCKISVWSTPKNPENHAHDIVRDVGRCAHEDESDNSNEDG